MPKPVHIGLNNHRPWERPIEEHVMGKKLYVGNLAFDVTSKELEELFAQAGICESVAIISDRDTGQ